MSEDHDYYAEIIGNNSDGWTLSYYDLNDKKQFMKLDSEDEQSAVDEAADYLGIEVDDIEVVYD